MIQYTFPVPYYVMDVKHPVCTGNLGNINSFLVNKKEGRQKGGCMERDWGKRKKEREKRVGERKEGREERRKKGVRRRRREKKRIGGRKDRIKEKKRKL